MEPEPFGERFIPPRILTAVGIGESGNRSVALSLLSDREETEIATSFERLGWRILIVYDELDALEILTERTPDLIITDRPGQFQHVAMMRDLFVGGKVPKLMVVVDDREPERMNEAWAAGAAAVMLRTVGADDLFNYIVVQHD
jgi:AmiR/NasT family two-component response regulator